MWLFFALLNAALLAGVIVFDKFIVDQVFTRPIQGLFITIPSAIVTLIALLPILEWPARNFLMLSLLAGLLLQGAQFFYFYAINETDDAGSLSAIESTYPVLVAVISFFIGRMLYPIQIVGIVIVVTSVFILRFAKFNIRSNKFFVFIILDICFLSSYGLLVDYILDNIPFLSFFGAYNLSIAFFGSLPFIFFSKERTHLSKAWKIIRNFLPLLSLMELGNIAAVISGAFALKLGHPALATSVMSTAPAFVFLYTLGLNKLPGLKHTFPIPQKLNYKTAIIVVLAVGLGLLSWGSF